MIMVLSCQIGILKSNKMKSNEKQNSYNFGGGVQAIQKGKDCIYFIPMKGWKYKWKLSMVLIPKARHIMFLDHF